LVVFTDNKIIHHRLILAELYQIVSSQKFKQSDNKVIKRQNILRQSGWHQEVYSQSVNLSTTAVETTASWYYHTLATLYT